MKRRLIDEWHKGWKWASVQCMALAASIQGSWMFIPDDMRTSLSPNAVKGATVLLLILGIIGRLTTPVEKDK